MASHKREDDVEWLQFFVFFLIYNRAVTAEFQNTTPDTVVRLRCSLTNPVPPFCHSGRCETLNTVPGKYIRSLTRGFIGYRESPATHGFLCVVHHHELATQRIPAQTCQGLPSRDEQTCREHSRPYHTTTSRVFRSGRDPSGETSRPPWPCRKRYVMAFRFKAMARQWVAR